jgi:hypothetical protein
MREFLRAQSSYHQAIRVNSRFDLLVKRAFCMFPTPMRSGSVDGLKEAIALEPQRYEAHLVHAYIRFESRGSRNAPVADAVKHIRLACEFGPDLAIIHHTAARILAHAARYEPELESEARQHLERAATLHIPRSLVEPEPVFEPWKSQDWFQALLQTLPPQRREGDITMDEIAVPPPMALAELQRVSKTQSAVGR